MIMSKGLSLAVAVLEQQYGVKSIAELPDEIVDRWREKHSYLFNTRETMSVTPGSDEQITVDVSKDHSKELMKICVPEQIFDETKEPLVTNKAIYYEALELIRTTNLNNYEIAKAIHRNKSATVTAISHLRNRYYYYFAANGESFRCASLVGLGKMVHEAGWPLQTKDFSYYRSQGGLVKAQNGNAYARVFRQVSLRHVTLMDEFGNIFKEM